jgi:uroporphyrin-III C-methyltransferase/precorrin-2 dehydrogenase/sirohydrochlorin ferrochelatase
VSAGLVSLVGAGPGDPQLLTLAARDRLERADLVLYDALVSPEVLALAPGAQRFYVGKRARRSSIAQETIHRLLIRAARRGRRVVRLKAGDPFVFGRGGEEALALDAAGVPFEIVPGISAALAAPALAGIPVTHRGTASAFVTVSGHDERAWTPVLEALPPQSATIVVLMGMTSRDAIARRLLARGWQAGTPAAVLTAASTPRARAWLGTLAGLAHGGSALEGDQAGTVVIGEVVRMAHRLGIVDGRPLADGVGLEGEAAPGATPLRARGAAAV